MINQLTFKNLSNETIDFNLDLLTIGPADWKLPIHEFEVSGDIRRAERTRPQQPGVFRSPTYVGKSTIHLEGDLLASTVEEANQQRIDFFRILFNGRPLNPPLRRLGDITLDLMGIDQTLSSADGVTVDGYPQFHLSNSNPTVVPYMITFVIFNGYLTGDSDGVGYFI